MGDAAAISALSSMLLSQQVRYRVLRLQNDAVEQQGQAALALLESAAGVAPGDALVAAATGLGGRLDLRA